MPLKRTMLAVAATVMSVAIAWSVEKTEPGANCTGQADSPGTGTGTGGNAADRQPMFSPGGWDDTATQDPLIPYGMFDESRLH